MSWDGIRRTIWKKELEELECIGNMHFTVAVPIEADPEFKAMVYAAGVTHSQGNKSIDHIYRKHSKKWIEEFDSENRFPGSVKQLLLKLRSIAITRAEALSAITLGNELPVGSFFAVNALIRLHATFQATVQLLNVGFSFEAESVIRLGFEQVAWSSAISGIDDVQKVIKTNPASSITDLKRYFAGAGTIYGRLSELAHISLKVHGRYITSEDEGLLVKIKTPDLTSESALLLLILLDAYLVVSEALFYRSGIPLENISDTEKLFENRCCIRLLNEYLKVLPENTLDIFSQWQN
jgi:hypothetical protein